jgi:hypothetical protein
VGTSLDARVTYFMLQCPTGASVVTFALWPHTISLCVIDLLKYCVCDIMLRRNSVDAGSCQRRPDCHLFRAGSVAMDPRLCWGGGRALIARLPPPTVRDSPNVQQLSNRSAA